MPPLIYLSLFFVFVSVPLILAFDEKLAKLNDLRTLKRLQDGHLIMINLVVINVFVLPH